MASEMAAVTKEKTQIQTTNALNGRVIDVKVKPLLLLIKKIMHLATTDVSGIVPLEDPGVLDKKILSKISLGTMHDLLVDTVSKISCEISCKCSDVQTTTQTIVETLSSYTLEAQIVITLAAFAVNYGKFWLVGRLYQTNELAKYVALLQQLPSALEPADTLKLKFKALIDVIKAVLDVTDCIFEIKDLPSQFISIDTPAFLTAKAYFRQAAHVIIQSIVICSSHITKLIGTEIMDSSLVDPLELSTQRGALISIHEKLKTQLVLCQNHIVDTQRTAAFEAFVGVFNGTSSDDLNVVTTMFSANNQSLLIDSSNTMIDIVKLRGKNMLLFISDLDVTRDELSYFHQLCNNWKNKKMEYRFVWVLMVDESTEWTAELQNQCVEKLNSLPWYMVSNPTYLDRALIRYIKEVWQFKYGKPQLVVIDHQGIVVNPNATHTVVTWGSSAISFIGGEGGWKEVTWSIQFLAASSFDPWITQWVQAGEYICLYGGDNIQWIENFKQKVEKFQGKIDRKINMLYVGKSNRKENVRKCVQKFALEENRLSSEAFMEKIRWFWRRLESMWYSKMQSINNKSEGMKDDNILKGILTMLSFDGSNQGWALISDWSTNMAKGKGELMETCLDESEQWMSGVKEGESFVPKLNEHLRAMIFEDHCCLPVILPSTIDIIPEVVPCIICDKPMKKMATYRCCKD